MSRSSSFYWAMRLLRRDRRQAMFALYDYCRYLDDVADGEAVREVKQAKLAAMRGALAALFETGVALAPELTALSPAITRFSLPRAELEAVIQGMEMDVNGPLTAPNWPLLLLYCRRVAGAVGLLSVCIFQRPDARVFALLLGEALQLTNILRDLAEDAEAGRLYIPAEILEQAGILVHSPQAVLSHPALPQACALLAAEAESRFRAAEAELAQIGAKDLWPAKVMMATYRAQLKRLVRHGWRGTPPRLGKAEKLWIALRHLA